jgi:endoglucanase
VTVTVQHGPRECLPWPAQADFLSLSEDNINSLFGARRFTLSAFVSPGISPAKAALFLNPISQFEMLALFALQAAAADWYSTSGKNLKNGAGSTARLSGLNWFGFETTNEVFHGLWAHGLHDMVTEVAQRSFNCWRIPISAKVLQDWKAGQPLLKWGNNPMYNQDLEGKTNLDVFDAFLADVKKAGKMKIYLDCHSVLDGTYMNNLWYDGTHPPEYVIGALEWFAKRYKDEDTIVGIDVKNEPHGRCDKTDSVTSRTT